MMVPLFYSNNSNNENNENNKNVIKIKKNELSEFGSYGKEGIDNETDNGRGGYYKVSNTDTKGKRVIVQDGNFEKAIIDDSENTFPNCITYLSIIGSFILLFRFFLQSRQHFRFNHWMTFVIYYFYIFEFIILHFPWFPL